MHSVRLGIWALWLIGILFVGLPDRVVAVIENPTAVPISLLVVSAGLGVSFLFLKPEGE